MTDQEKYDAYLAKLAAMAVEFAGRVECRYCGAMMAPSDENRYWTCPECGCRIHMAHAQLVALPA